MSNTNQKIETLNKLRTVEAIYVLMSSCTRMPYVVCDPETFDPSLLHRSGSERRGYEASEGGKSNAACQGG